MQSRKIAWRAALASSLLVIAGCASFSQDGGFDSVRTAVQERTGADPRWIRNEDDRADMQSSVKRMLSAPLTAESAVQIALVNNRGLQATYAELGISEADLVQAGRLPNPVFAFERLARGDELEIGRAIIVNVLGLITMPARTEIERQRFEATKLRVATEASRIASDTRRAYYAAVAAHEGVKYMDQVKDAAEASAELARRMAKAGNFSKLESRVNSSSMRRRQLSSRECVKPLSHSARLLPD
jgi:outer membrane protein TolC